MALYLLLARVDDRPAQDERQLNSIRGSIEQLSRDPTVTATYGVLHAGAVMFALLCEVPTCHGAEELAAMAGAYGLTRVEALPLIGPDELRESLSGASDGSSVHRGPSKWAADRRMASGSSARV